MSETHRLEDEATLYVLGRLDDAQRREFESELAQSADLRKLVQELEEGAVALAISAPRRDPPREVWSRIENEVAREASSRVTLGAWWAHWWRHGWAAAAACLVGWILYAVWVNADRSAGDSPSSVASETPQILKQVEMQGAKVGNAVPDEALEREAALRALQVRLQEITAMRWQLAELTNQMALLSQVLAHQQMLLSESNRLRFFQLDPSASGTGAGGAGEISTNLQRALFLAVSRELGWVRSPGEASASRTLDGQGRFSEELGVDFVDLRPGSNPVTNASVDNTVGVNPGEVFAAQSLSSSSASAPTNAIPGFISGTTAVMAFDPATMTAGTSLSFVTTTPAGQPIALGTATPGNNPVVVMVPFGGIAGSGNIIVFAVGPSGGSNILGQFPVQAPPP
jgi:anti-sigma-K factor RskA